MTPRVVDWSLAFVVWTLFATGVLSLYTGRGGEAWIFVAHGVLGFALAALLVWKLRRVWRRVGFGLVALFVVTLALVSGWVWSSGGDFVVGGYNLLAWHMIVATLLVVVVVAHAVQRRKPLRPRDVSAGGRRQFLALGGVAVGAFAVWQAQQPFNSVLGLRGARRRFSGSYERGSFAGNEGFPATSWVADRRPGAARRPRAARLPVGQVGRPDRADRRPGRRRAGVDGVVERHAGRPRRGLSVSGLLPKLCSGDPPS